MPTPIEQLRVVLASLQALKPTDAMKQEIKTVLTSQVYDISELRQYLVDLLEDQTIRNYA